MGENGSFERGEGFNDFDEFRLIITARRRGLGSTADRDRHFMQILSGDAAGMGFHVQELGAHSDSDKPPCDRWTVINERNSAAAVDQPEHGQATESA